MDIEKINLDPEEKELLDSYEKGEWVSMNPTKAQLEEYAKGARYTLRMLRKNERINIRISKQDLAGIQAKAVEEGIPYQTLIASIIHKYVTGLLIQKN